MVSEMNRAIEFYTSILGLELVAHYGEHYAEVQAPDLLIGLHPRSENIIQGSNMSIGFGVTEFDTEVEELRTKGIVINVEKDGWIRLAHFEDPDNNLLFLAERKEEE